MKKEFKFRKQALTPLDGHADDWDYTLASKHVTLSNASSSPLSTHICVVLLNPSQIGLARYALSNIINYFFRVENTSTYQLIVSNATSKIQKELHNDFPVDQFIETNDGQLIQQVCWGEYILTIKEASFARWGTMASGKTCGKACNPAPSGRQSSRSHCIK